MNWFDTSGLTSLAKTALKEAQKTLDKALDIQDESGEEEEAAEAAASKSEPPAGSSNTPQKDSSDFFSSWGLTVSAESAKDDESAEQSVVTEKPSKATSQSVWGSFAGSFFEPPTEKTAIVRPPKAKSMNVISDVKYGSQDDLFSKSQLVMSDSEALESGNLKSQKPEERRGSSRSQQLSLVSSRNSSDSVEVLSQSLKTTPESPSVQSISHSSSIGPKVNSESVEILPDSLISPSSIECLGFDSYSSPSSNLSPDTSDKKSTSVGEKTEKLETADSVSLVADDDEDTMSYNSISECTAPTVLDTDDKSASPFPKPIRSEPQRKLEKEFIHLDPAFIAQRMHMSENSSNDGSWSDRTLNADNDSVILDITATEEQKKEQDDMLMEKLSDSSSFYNVNVTSSEMIRSESSAFVNVEKQQCHGPDSSESSQRDGSVKERISPISSDSKSDLVKIGSDRTSGHTSGDELETATSSDIEIIPSPNGDNGHSFCRSSPAKYSCKLSKFDGTTSPNSSNLVDLVLGKSIATKIKGHNRELSGASIQSNTSDESQGSENEILKRRLCEMAELLDARESRLLDLSRNNAELAEHNDNLKSQVESLLAKHEIGDINMITEDYAQRMSALEKKFQQAIREKDQLRKQLDTVKESSSRKNSAELENALKEKDDMIAQLQEEGEKLSRHQLQQSNIIKKLRAKEKDNEQVIKSLRDKVAEQSSELDRMKRSLSAKEETEVNQIEAVYRLTTANKKMEVELLETKILLDDTLQRLESTRISLEATRSELAELQRSSAELQRAKDARAQLKEEKERMEMENDRLRAEVQQLRADMMQEEKRWISREEALRRELTEARELCSALESRECAAGDGSAALLAQLAVLQRSALEREHAHTTTTRHLSAQLAEAEAAVTKAVERERLSREENQGLQERLATSEGLLQDVQNRLSAVSAQCQTYVDRVNELEEVVNSKTRELDSMKCEYEARISDLTSRLSGLERQLAAERSALDTEKKRNLILQEQLAGRGDVSPPHSVSSDTFSASLWPPDEGAITPTHSGTAHCVEETLAQLTRRDGELRALTHTLAQLRQERDAMRTHLARLQGEVEEYRAVQEQYDALLQMYGEKEEQLAELRLDLQDVTQLYKAQLDELIALKQRR